MEPRLADRRDRPADATSSRREVLLDAIQPFASEGGKELWLLGEEKMPGPVEDGKSSSRTGAAAIGTSVGTQLAPAAHSGSRPDRETGGRAQRGK